MYVSYLAAILFLLFIVYLGNKSCPTCNNGYNTFVDALTLMLMLCCYLRLLLPLMCAVFFVDDEFTIGCMLYLRIT